MSEKIDTRKTLAALKRNLKASKKFPLVAFKGFEVEYVDDSLDDYESGVMFYVSDPSATENAYFDMAQYVHDFAEAVREGLTKAGVTIFVKRNWRAKTATWTPQKPKPGEVYAEITKPDHNRVNVTITRNDGDRKAA